MRKANNVCELSYNCANILIKVNIAVLWDWIHFWKLNQLTCFDCWSKKFIFYKRRMFLNSSCTASLLILQKAEDKLTANLAKQAETGNKHHVSGASGVFRKTKDCSNICENRAQEAVGHVGGTDSIKPGLAVCLHSSIVHKEWPSPSGRPHHDLEPSTARTKKRSWFKPDLFGSEVAQRK